MSNKGKWPTRNFSERYSQDENNDFVTSSDLVAGAGGSQQSPAHRPSALERECVTECAKPTGHFQPPTSSEVAIPLSEDILRGKWNEATFRSALNDSKVFTPHRGIILQSHTPRRLKQEISQENLTCGMYYIYSRFRQNWH
ncbi:Protein of unknown function [Gryllus bimaculatus]|nr:Protein of unknown function [Gryllus bimaculatus]